MSRVSSTDVEEIVEVDSTISLTPFITAASALTDWLESEDEDGLLTVDLLFEIERYLSAHLYSIRDQLYQSKNTGGASGSFQGQTAMFLKASQYGQMAMLLDVTGLLTKRSLEAEQGSFKAEVTWLGEEYASDGTH